ncbi:MAG TPA: type VI secretion system baseplate subunit TssE [Polyangia bacterium]|nr:type VI secretion system baseplate subunit TssE [Polyangia bacterium]
MPRSRTLLERLVDPRAEAQRTTRLDTEALADSVLSHLYRMLNTQRGSALAAPDYGVPEFSEVIHNFPDAIMDLQRAMKACIERYEPRLRDVSIKYTPVEDDLLILRFEITARLALEDSSRPVWFETTIDSSGKASVKR